MNKYKEAKNYFIDAITIHSDFIEYLKEDEELIDFIKAETKWYASL